MTTPILICLSLIFPAVGVVVVSVVSTIGYIRASAKLHHRLLLNILRCSMTFFETIPLGRILNRFSADIEMLDSSMPEKINEFLICLFECVAIMVVISVSTPVFLATIIPLAVLYYFTQVYKSRSNFVHPVHVDVVY